MPPFLIKGRYGEPILTRIYNNTPVDRAQNGGFGRNETQLHFHNAHNGAESDGATGAHHFPGTFYDYRWSTTLARRDKINTNGNDNKAAGPDNGTGIVKVPGDFRELQGTMWAHDHRFFFTAENVYKGNLGMVNYYSGPRPRPRDHHLRHQPAAARAARGSAGATSTSTSTWSSPTAPPTRTGSTSSTSSPPTASWATCRSSTSPMRPTWRCCRASTASASSTRACRASQAGAQLQRRAGAVQVHRQRRQLRRQSDHADGAGRAGHRRALRHRRRLLDVPGRLAGSSSSTS